jgi:transcriptional regulator with XRE-family HTH domain
VKKTKAPDPIDRHVGARVRMQRLATKMSQEKLGEALGLTFQQVQKYEKGVNRIGASRLQQIAKVLKVSPSFFFEGAGGDASSASGFAEGPQTEYVTSFLSTAEGFHLNHSFARIKDPKLRKKVLDLVAALADQQVEPPPSSAEEPAKVKETETSGV